MAIMKTIAKLLLLVGVVKEVVIVQGEDVIADDIVDETKRKDKSYVVVSALEGGWPNDLVGEPFQHGESLFCQVDECNGGFDWHDAKRMCRFKSKANSTHVNLECPSSSSASHGSDNENDSILVSHVQVNSRCCERNQDNDTSIYKSSKSGLYFASLMDPSYLIQAVELLERDYPEFMKFDDNDNKVLLLHYHSIDNSLKRNFNIPDRIKTAQQNHQFQYYQDIYRATVRQVTLGVEDKRYLAQRVLKLQQQKPTTGALPFPTTFLSCRDALEASESSTTSKETLYYLKDTGGTRGVGIRVLTRTQLETMHKSKQCQDSTIVIQEAITDLMTISGKRVDFRFYILVHNGKIYFHTTHALMMYLENAPGSFFDPSDPHSMQKSATRELGDDGAVVRAYSHEQPELWKDWMDAILDGLRQILPVFERVVKATLMSKHLYHIWGGDAMIRSNGEVVFPEFNDWPDVKYSAEKGYKSKLLNAQEFGPVVHGEFQDFYYDFVGKVFADFYAIVLGLEDQSRDSSESFCGGRVTEVKPHPVAAKDDCEV